MTKQLGLEDVENAVFEAVKLISEIKKYEPVPPFNTRYAGRLESCLAVPFQEFGGFMPYPDIISQASVLFYHLNKGHCFVNGNKRIAIYSLLYFLHINDNWLKISTDDLYNFSIDVAKSDATKKDEELKSINQFISNHVIQLEVSLDAAKK